ncbi:hypothetical protein FGO68_gene8567 [Halteria grandinella]|uniref:TLDc domain-containing protein n=1 Tax=Halteria grandinella TaxID=5974 RepID=A0A8J8T2A4_HALGN|nr:hypothetical protein FGO68_gene8567 [Halteria grandinella]
MQQQLKLISCCASMSAVDAVKAAGVRSELDAIGVSVMFARVVSKQNAQIADLTKLIDSRFEEMKAELQKEREACVNDQLQQSLILRDHEKQSKMKLYFQQACTHLRYSRLLYRGSADGFTAASFHRLCDNIQNTLTIVKTTHGKIIGGFTTKAWTPTGTLLKDVHAWLFNIEAPSIFKVKQGGEQAIGTNQEYGPIFGGGNDLCIAENSNTYNNSVKGHSYQYGENGSNLLLSKGKVIFTVQDIEVYQLYDETI